MKEILINGVCYYYDPEEIKKALTDVQRLQCIRDYKGNPIYGCVRARRMVEAGKYKEILKYMTEGQREGRGDQKAGRGKRRKDQ